MRDLIFLLIQRADSKIDITKISKELGISRKSISEYISFLEGRYFIYLLRSFSKKKNTKIRKTPKVYFRDTEILNKFAKLTEGVIFENAVFLTLRRKGEVNYYRKKSSVEIDFIFNKNIAYEVKINADENDLKNLRNSCKKVEIKKSCVISKNYHHSLKIIHPVLL